MRRAQLHTCSTPTPYPVWNRQTLERASKSRGTPDLHTSRAHTRMRAQARTRARARRFSGLEGMEVWSDNGGGEHG